MCYIHVGTHKTGTTSIQRMLAANDVELARLGCYVPRAGRSAPSDGHHNVAWELAGDTRFDAARGSLLDVLREVEAAGTPRAIISSEDFEYLHASPDKLSRLSDGFAAIGYAVMPVIYLRPQAGYSESLYAELVKHGLTEPFDDFLDSLLAAGEYRFGRWCFTFDYDRLVEGFASVFGAQHIIVRPYSDTGDGVVGDLLHAIGAGRLSLASNRGRSLRLNTGQPFARVMEQLQTNVSSAPIAAPIAAPRIRLSVAGAFDPIHLREAYAVTARFNVGNGRVFRRYGVAIPCIGGADVCGDILTAIGIEAGSRVRKQLMNELAIRAAPGGSKPARAARMRRTPARWRARIWRRLRLGPVAPAARSEIIAVGAALIGGAALVPGLLSARTSLTEFGLLSALAAAAAAARFARCALAAAGTLVDEPFFAEWVWRLLMTGYAIVALYASLNAVFDLEIPRHTPDWVSLRGAAAIGSAVTVWFTLPIREAGLIAFGCIALLIEPLHAVDPAWWLDTIVDAVAVVVALSRYQFLWHRLENRDTRPLVVSAGTPTGE